MHRHFVCSIMEGGAKTGFRHVEPEEYVPRLLKFNGKGRHVTVSEVSLSIKHSTCIYQFMYMYVLFPELTSS